MKNQMQRQIFIFLKTKNTVLGEGAWGPPLREVVFRARAPRPPSPPLPTPPQPRNPSEAGQGGGESGNPRHVHVHP